MGVVWAAVHTVTRRRVALKFLKDRSADSATRLRFVREARAACAVAHVGILPVHDVVESEDGEPALVMDLLEGEPLSATLERESKLTLDETARVLLPVFAGVAAAHAAGVVHRDLKPDNIFLSKDGVRVLDFGLAKATLLDVGVGRSVAQSGAVVGTPRYMSPEQAFGERDVDYRSDIWALGLVAYECLSGTLPTRHDNLGQILKTILSGRIAKLSTLAPELPADVCAMVDRMIRRDREERPQGLAEVARTFAQATAQPLPDIPPPKRRGELAGEPVSSERTSTQAAFSSDSSPSAKPRLRPVALVGVLGFVLVALAFFSFDSSHDQAVVDGVAPARLPDAPPPRGTPPRPSATATAAATPSASSQLASGAPTGSAAAAASVRPRRARPVGSSDPYAEPDLDF